MFSRENESGESHKSLGSDPPPWPADSGPAPQSTGVALELLPGELLSLKLSRKEYISGAEQNNCPDFWILEGVGAERGEGCCSTGQDGLGRT